MRELTTFSCMYLQARVLLLRPRSAGEVSQPLVIKRFLLLAVFSVSSGFFRLIISPGMLSIPML
jgi:hypothetical protein